MTKVFSDKVHGGYTCPDGVFRPCPSGIARMGKDTAVGGRWRVKRGTECVFFADTTYGCNWLKSMEAAFQYLKEKENGLRVAGTHIKRKSMPIANNKISDHIWMTAYTTKGGMRCHRFSISVGPHRATIYIGTDDTFDRRYPAILKKALLTEEKLMEEWLRESAFKTPSEVI